MSAPNVWSFWMNGEVQNNLKDKLWKKKNRKKINKKREKERKMNLYKTPSILLNYLEK